MAESFGTGIDKLSLDPNEQYLIFVTPTYRRLTQLPDMIRVKQALLLVPRVIWIVIEDSDCRHSEVYSYIKDFPLLVYTNQQLANVPSSYNKGAEQRNLAIRIVRSHLNLFHNSVVYFGDDDNTYNSALLPMLFRTHRLSVFNVGLINEAVEGPMSKAGKFVGWQTLYRGKWFQRERKFCIDMAGFAVSADYLSTSDAFFNPKGTRGYLETDFLELFDLDLAELEVLTSADTEIVAWHTKTSYMRVSLTMSKHFTLLVLVGVIFILVYCLVIGSLKAHAALR
jgi:hypothetical protein